MATRPAWTVNEDTIKEQSFVFQWNGGFSKTQKQKNIRGLHDAIKKEFASKILEVSTKSDIELGVKLSAFNLKLDGVFLENVFQSSKKYERGGPYRDLLNVEPKSAKQDERHKSSGKLISFVYEFEEWELYPKTAFYDYVYIKACLSSLPYDELIRINEYDWFTDIEFNPEKSINCQARSVALLKYILLKDILFVLNKKDEWMKFHSNVMR